MVCGFLWIFIKIETSFIKSLLYKIQIHSFKLDLDSLLRGEALLVNSFVHFMYLLVFYYAYFCCFPTLKKIKPTANSKNPLYISPVSLSLSMHCNKQVWNHSNNNKLSWLLNPHISNTFHMLVKYYVMSSWLFQM